MPRIPRLTTIIEFPKLPRAKPDDVFNALRAAAIMAGQIVRTSWEARAIELNVRRTGAYLRGLRGGGKVRLVSAGLVGNEDNPVYEVIIDVVNTAPHARWVEEGHGAFHLPDHIDWNNTSGSIKRTKEGKPYLHIPFRHYAFVPTNQHVAKGVTAHAARHMMPHDVHKEAAKLDRTIAKNVGPVTRPMALLSGGQYQQHVARDAYTKTGGHKGSHSLKRPEGFHRPGQLVSSRRETWQETRGARSVGTRDGKELVNPAWGSSKFEGLMKTGAPRHTKYMTVRVITPDSPGWNIPAQPGKYIAKQVGEAAPREIAPFLSEHVRDVLLSRGYAG